MVVNKKTRRHAFQISTKKVSFNFSLADVYFLFLWLFLFKEYDYFIHGVRAITSFLISSEK